MNKRNVMQVSEKLKKEKQDNIIEELLREKAAVLARAGMAVEEVIEKLMRVDREIENKISLLNSIDCNDGNLKLLRKKQLIHEEINCNVKEFNSIRKKAQLQYYYLIVTREALGLRRHEMVQKVYQIPDKKEKIRAT